MSPGPHQTNSTGNYSYSILSFEVTVDAFSVSDDMTIWKWTVDGEAVSVVLPIKEHSVSRIVTIQI